MQETHSNTADPALSQMPRSLSKSAFAKFVEVSPGRISQMVKQGLPVEADGKIDVARGKLWISENINHTRAASHAKGPTLFGEEKQKTSLTAERARLAKEQADAAEIKNAILRKELVHASDVEREWAAVLRKVRAGVLAVPSRVRQLLPHLTPHDVEVFDNELRRALEDLANDD
ncbi:DNA packaging protein [Martelella lutilitoris]|uniref:DNA packaging protein n=1 Tax=Martelella lutilitoris TaxID=2583532 RepID=A0A7T7HMZ2_9HYPH|nr:DNA packaging protein [Martelella lutilitoris]QQM31977.1 DNA packaging protein [Martelella lutilitoris]